MSWLVWVAFIFVVYAAVGIVTTAMVHGVNNPTMKYEAYSGWAGALWPIVAVLIVGYFFWQLGLWLVEREKSAPEVAAPPAPALQAKERKCSRCKAVVRRGAQYCQSCGGELISF